MTSLPPCIAILGPTCCWKSSLGIRLAKHFNGEVISCDSMQVYRHLDIGTAKATVQERDDIPHHLIDVLELDAPYDANRFVAMATAALADIASRGKTAFLVGGTGLYARALIYGFNMLPANPDVFQRLDRLCAAPGGKEELIARLETAAASRNEQIPEECRLNPRRLVRACEVLELTGELPWHLKQRNDTPAPSFLQFCIVPQLAMVKDRIRQRTRQMLADGWIQEAQAADALGLMDTPTARQALGYREIIGYLHGNGPKTEDELAEILANKTIQYARRQLTWFKHQHPHAILLEPPELETAPQWLCQSILNSLENTATPSN